MHSEIPPESISFLNIFERNLIQLGKCFQTIIKLKTLKYNLKSYSDFVPAMKEIAIHLPLSCEATHDHVRDTLPSADKLNILIDSIPTKEKKIWLSLVNMKKILLALKYLKIIKSTIRLLKLLTPVNFKLMRL
jgi:hypothetical protein